ncbi:thiopurine S-methyltransferase-like [Oratosquilla oratoria]|uniref:thiopurine S-methyltransferase-like n=1 Tax=Oratosquilla oratoria TaxID=337810 RepID=UPI003F761BAA
MGEGSGRVEMWSNYWTSGGVYWQLDGLNYVLADFHERLLEPDDGSTQAKRVFVPLCGKTVDMKWLYDRGHLVTGVEAVQKPIVEFFDEHRLSYVEETLPWATLYKSENGRLKIYQCDIFSVDPDHLGKFDAVWDRGSLVAIYERDRERYASLLKSLFSPSARYLLSAISYDPSPCYEGPPYSLPQAAVYHLFGDVCDCELLTEYDFRNYIESVLLLTLKKT